MESNLKANLEGNLARSLGKDVLGKILLGNISCRVGEVSPSMRCVSGTLPCGRGPAAERSISLTWTCGAAGKAPQKGRPRRADMRPKLAMRRGRLRAIRG